MRRIYIQIIIGLTLFLILNVSTLPYCAEADQHTGSIRVNTAPEGLEVYLDGQLEGTTPITIRDVPVGTHTIEIPSKQERSLFYQGITRKIYVKAFSTEKIDETLEVRELTGTVIITSKPSNAKVYINGDYQGITPLTLNDFPVGTYKVRFKKNGYTSLAIIENIDTGRNYLNGELKLSYIFYIVIPLLLFIILFRIVWSKRKSKSDKSSKLVSKNDESLNVVLDEVEDVQNDESTSVLVQKVEDTKDEDDGKGIHVVTENTESIKHTDKPTPVVVNSVNDIHSENKSINVVTKSAFSYKGATIIYKVKLENHTAEPIADLQIALFVPDVFLLENKQKSISMLEPNESKTVTFEIRPTGECGDCNVSGKVNYYDYSMKKRNEIDLETKSLSIVCPLLHPKSIEETEWRNSLTNFTKAEENTKEIDMPASALFEVTSDILQDMNLFMLEPNINDSSNLYRAMAKFYAEGVKGLKYAAQIEVIGSSKKSKLILKAWAEREEALTGFYHGILDEIEKRVQVKDFIDNTTVYNSYHYGDKVGTQVKDSLVQRSTVGNNDDKECSECGEKIVGNGKFCMNCGTNVN